MNADRATVTSSIETGASPESVMQVLSNPRMIPGWAPGFADRVEGNEGGYWIVTKGDRTFPIEVVAFGPARTVDYLREVGPGKKGGAYLRVLPGPSGGSVIVLTLPVPPGTSTEEIATTLDQELQELAKLSTSL